MVTNASRTISSIIIMKNRETADRVRPPKILVYNQDECRSITLPSGISLIYMVRSYVPFVTSRPPVSDGPGVSSVGTALPRTYRGGIICDIIFGDTDPFIGMCQEPVLLGFFKRPDIVYGTLIHGLRSPEKEPVLPDIALELLVLGDIDICPFRFDEHPAGIVLQVEIVV
jgi:hypothetical protein